MLSKARRSLSISGLRIAAIRLACLDVAATAAFGCEGQTIAPSNPTALEHCAIVLRDMGAVIAALTRIEGWTAISQAGPETLPAASGGVIAFKVRNPEGHPLEFLQFLADAVPEIWRAEGQRLWLDIDHSAIAVADTTRACIFYT